MAIFLKGHIRFCSQCQIKDVTARRPSSPRIPRSRRRRSPPIRPSPLFLSLPPSAAGKVGLLEEASDEVSSFEVPCACIERKVACMPLLVTFCLCSPTATKADSHNCKKMKQEMMFDHLNLQASLLFLVKVSLLSTTFFLQCSSHLDNNLALFDGALIYVPRSVCGLKGRGERKDLQRHSSLLKVTLWPRATTQGQEKEHINYG